MKRAESIAPINVPRAAVLHEHPIKMSNMIETSSSPGVVPYLNKTKIICTIGPKTQSVEMLGRLVEAGMNVMRLNFSHGNHDFHRKSIQNLRTYLASCRVPKIVGILLDTKGPEIRTGKLKTAGSELRLQAGQSFSFYATSLTGKPLASPDTTPPRNKSPPSSSHEELFLEDEEAADYKQNGDDQEEILGDINGVAVSYPSLAEAVQPGDIILVDDGLLSFRVTSLADHEVHTVVLNDGVLGETKGVNLPGIPVIDLPAITEKDKQDLRFGVEMGVDFIAASFIRQAADVLTIRELLRDLQLEKDLEAVRVTKTHQSVVPLMDQDDSCGSNDALAKGNVNLVPEIQIISKIENQQGLDNFDEILAVSDGIMVARGDLGVEIPVEQVFRAQKAMIRKCNFAGKACITATQMLESMVVHPRPTRAEATDVANAVLDGSDCVMLSGETAKGNYPVEAVKMMASICREAEADIDYPEVYAALRRAIRLPISISESIASVAVKTAWDVHAPLIIALTERGNTARAICKYRPIPPVIAVTASPRVAQQFQILRGIYPFLTDTMQGTENVITKAMLYGVQLNLAACKDNIVITSGRIEQLSGSTNMMKVYECIGFEV